jgi:hypothetical protein
MTDGVYILLHFNIIYSFHKTVNNNNYQHNRYYIQAAEDMYQNVIIRGRKSLHNLRCYVK